jgi:hypothetical protein
MFHKTLSKKLTDTFVFVETCPIPSEAPASFPDLWEPKHFAWKIWIYKTLVAEPALAGRMILYMDAGCFMCRWPTSWLQRAQEEDICFLEDPARRTASGATPSSAGNRRHGVREGWKSDCGWNPRLPCWRGCTFYPLCWRMASLEQRSVIVGEKI